MRGALRVPVQIVFDSGHTSESYVSEQGWQSASIEHCPKCGGRLQRHGTYPRKVPDGTRVARLCCRPCKMTVSLLPSFLASGYSGVLAVQREAVEVAEAHLCFDDAARRLRPDIELQGARRWLRRRIARHRLALLIVATVLATPIQQIDLFALREIDAERLRAAPTPTGLAHRPLGRWNGKDRIPHPMGPDPPLQQR